MYRIHSHVFTQYEPGGVLGRQQRRRTEFGETDKGRPYKYAPGLSYVWYFKTS